MKETSRQNIVGYYVELFHTQLDKNYILQTKVFKNINEATQFVKQITYVDSDLGVDLMALVGTEEDYDIYKVGYYLEHPEGFVLVVTREELVKEEI